MAPTEAVPFPVSGELCDSSSVWHPELRHPVQDMTTEPGLDALACESSGLHVGTDDRLIPVDTVFDGTSFGEARLQVPLPSAVPIDRLDMTVSVA